MTSPTYWCEQQTFAGNQYEPPEYCDNDAIEGEDFCADHLPYEPDPDRERDL